MFRTLTPIFSIVIAFTVFFTITNPILAEIRGIQDETNEYREAVEKAEDLNRELQKLVSKKNSYSANMLERLEALVPDQVDEVKLLIDVEAIAKEYGMLIGEVSVTDGEAGADLSEHDTVPELTFDDDFIPSDITLTLIGTYDEFREVLAEIEQSLVLMEVVDLSFEVNDSDLQQYNLTLRSYALAPFSQ